MWAVHAPTLGAAHASHAAHAGDNDSAIQGPAPSKPCPPVPSQGAPAPGVPSLPDQGVPGAKLCPQLPGQGAPNHCTPTAGAAEPWPRVHAFNCLRHLYNDSTLAIDTSGYYSQGVQVSAWVVGLQGDRENGSRAFHWQGGRRVTPHRITQGALK